MPSEADLIADLYRLFGRYDLNGELGVCVCNVCCSAEQKAALIATPVHEISKALLSEFTGAVYGGPDSEIKHFLPRYFDLILAGEIPCFFDLDGSLARLQHYDWLDSWPADEASAVQRGFEAIARAAAREDSALTTRTSENLLGAIACGVNAHANIGGMLLAAGDVGTRFAAVQVASVMAETWTIPIASGDEVRDAPPNGYDWRGRNEEAIAWLESADLKSWLEEAFWASEDVGDLQILSDALQYLKTAAPRFGLH